MNVTASNIVSDINHLDRNVLYNYINPRTKGLIKIQHVDLPEGPIGIKRWNPAKGESESSARIESISTEMIWRVANAFKPNHPINLDRVLGASYNTRSVLESLIAYTPQFYYCYPGRVETLGSVTKVKNGHKHLLWNPDLPHFAGKLFKADTDIVISECPVVEAVYSSIQLSTNSTSPEIDIDGVRRHAQIQIALYFIGLQLGFRTWIAKNDRSIIYQNKPISEYEGVIDILENENLLRSFQDAAKAALLIDCIWFKNGRLMPAVMEVEHSTGVTSGLTRMKTFKDKFPPFQTRYVIVAPDELREKVFHEANKSQFQDLDARYFSYSAVEELYALCQKRHIRGVTEDFLDCYMEPILQNQMIKI